MFEKIFTAALEITYPPIPGYVTPSPNCTGGDCLGIFISYWFGFLTMLAVIIALISLAVAGIQYTASAGNPGVQGDARDRIKGAVLGLVLTVSAFIILKTINPAFITPTMTPLPGVAGVFLVNSTGERKPVGIEVSNVQQVPAIKEGFTDLLYDCKDIKVAPILYIWEFPKPGLEGGNGDLTGVNVLGLICNQKKPVSGLGSFRMAFETPGVYAFLKEGCKGYMSGPVLSDISDIPPLFKNKIKSVGVVNGSDTKFGFVMHKDINFRGACDGVYGIHTALNPGGNNCANITMPGSSMTVFNWNNDVKSSGNGITFYSKPNGWAARNSGDQSGFFALGFDQIGQCMNQGVCGIDPAKIDFQPSYDIINTPEEYKQNCPTFKECQGSIKIQGKYLVALYASQPDNRANYQCQVFRNDDVPNLPGQGYASEGRKLFWVNVVPLK